MRIYILLMFTIIIALFAACAVGEAALEAIAVTPDTPFTLQLHEAAALEAKTITIVFDKILEEGRCPVTAECITAGSVRVQVSVDGQPYTLTLGDLMPGDQSSVNIEGKLTLELLAVSPYPESIEDTPNAVETIILVVTD